MKKLPILLILFFFSAQGFAAGCPDGSEPIKSVSEDGTYFVYNCGGSSSNINFPGKFYTTEIKSCKAMVNTPTFSEASQIKKVKGLIGYDWHADWEANSTSLRPSHNALTLPIQILMTATHNALGNKNQDNVIIAKNLLVDLAKADTLYDSIGYIEVQKKPGCYANGDPNSPCWFHEYQYARNVFARYIITSLWLRDELNEQEFKIVDQYINQMYKKFIKPIEFHKEEKGFYQMANGGMVVLAYASWTNDKELAAKEITHRFKEIDKLFFEDGYINDNSFRGYKGQYYHSLGLDSALGYVYVAKLWGADVPEKIQNKLVKASEVTNLAITDWDKFKSRQHTEIPFNAILDSKNAAKHTHQQAFALGTLMKIVTGVELEYDAEYSFLVKNNGPVKYNGVVIGLGDRNGTDAFIGFNPNCIL